MKRKPTNKIKEGYAYKDANQPWTTFRTTKTMVPMSNRGEKATAPVPEIIVT